MAHRPYRGDQRMTAPTSAKLGAAMADLPLVAIRLGVQADAAVAIGPALVAAGAGSRRLGAALVAHCQAHEIPRKLLGQALKP